MGGIKGEEQEWEVVSWRCTSNGLYVGVFMCVCSCEKESSAGSTYLSCSPSSRETSPSICFPFCFCWASHEALFSSLPSFLCFSAAVVTTSPLVEWITEQLQLVLSSEKGTGKDKQRDSCSHRIGLMVFVHQLPLLIAKPRGHCWLTDRFKALQLKGRASCLMLCCLW